MRFTDSHTHLQDGRFDEDRALVLRRAEDAGVSTIIVCGEDLESSRAATALAAATASPRILATVGVHPHQAAQATPPVLQEIEAMASEPGVVAIGEIGLDFYRELAPRDVQRRALDEQLRIAARLGLPVCLHSRDAEADLEPHLARFGAMSPVTADTRPLGVMHAFGGTLEQARHYVALGFLISLACSAGYPRNEEARRVAAGLPLDTLLIETDSPALPPQAKRGTRNEPASVVATAEVIAAARGEDLAHVAAATAENANRLFAPVTAGARS